MLVDILMSTLYDLPDELIRIICDGPRAYRALLVCKRIYAALGPNSARTLRLLWNIGVQRRCIDNRHVTGCIIYGYVNNAPWTRNAFVIHNSGGPAVEHSDGSREWWTHGRKCSTADKPAEITHTRRAWYSEGLIHRAGGPADERLRRQRAAIVAGVLLENPVVIVSKWYMYGKLHRIDGPAVEGRHHTQWLQMGKYHRIGAPAISTRVLTAWYVHGRLHREDGPAYMHVNGNTKWYLAGLRHRVDGPAHVDKKGMATWYIAGRLHRNDGPAYTTKYIQMWYICGRLHREDGPAIITQTGVHIYMYMGIIHRTTGHAIEAAGAGICVQHGRAEPHDTTITLGTHIHYFIRNTYELARILRYCPRIIETHLARHDDPLQVAPVV